MCGNWKPIKAWAHAHTQKTLPQTLDRHPPFTCKMISAGVRVTQRNTWDRVVGFPCFRRTNVGNKVPINVPACQVNNAWSRVNNWSHTSYTFSSSLCWIIEGGIVIFWGTSGFSPPPQTLEMFYISKCRLQQGAQCLELQGTSQLGRVTSLPQPQQTRSVNRSRSNKVRWHEIFKSYGKYGTCKSIFTEELTSQTDDIVLAPNFIVILWHGMQC